MHSLTASPTLGPSRVAAASRGWAAEPILTASLVSASPLDAACSGMLPGAFAAEHSQAGVPAPATDGLGAANLLLKLCEVASALHQDGAKRQKM